MSSKKSKNTKKNNKLSIYSKQLLKYSDELAQNSQGTSLCLLCLYSMYIPYQPIPSSFQPSSMR